MSEKDGPELDAKLAELMGLEVCRNVECEGCEAAMYLTDVSGWSPNPIWQYGDRGQPYSSDVSAAIAAAEEWCDKQDRPTWFVLESASPGFRPRAEVRQGAVTISKSEAETLARALTLARVAALSAEPVDSMKGGAR